MNVIRFNLKGYRTKKKLTQEELANKLGVSQAMVSQYEKNWWLVQNSTILQIADSLSVDPMELFLDDAGVSAKDLNIQVDFYPDDFNLDD